MSTFGPTYSDALDGSRLNLQQVRIRTLMLDGGWRTLYEIHCATGYPEASISAQLRHLRKARFGSYQVDRRRRAQAGLWEYRVLPPVETGQQLTLMES